MVLGPLGGRGADPLAIIYFPLPLPVFFAAADCARASKEPFAVWPLPDLAPAAWIRAAAAVVIGVFLDMIMSSYSFCYVPPPLGFIRYQMTIQGWLGTIGD